MREVRSPRWKLSVKKAAVRDKDKKGSACDRMCVDLLVQALHKWDLADVRFHIRGVWVESGHRSVLCAKSPVFARMFQNDTEEKHTGIVKLDDVTAEGLAAFLELIYLGALVSSSCAAHPSSFCSLDGSSTVYVCLWIEMVERNNDAKMCKPISACFAI
jgi:hypothetical protein